MGPECVAPKITSSKRESNPNISADLITGTRAGEAIDRLKISPMSTVRPTATKPHL